MTTNLMQASAQWSNRPADQRYPNVKALLAASFFAAHNSHTRNGDIRRTEVVVGNDGNLMLGTPHDKTLAMTHWSFGQLCNRVGAPASYLRQVGPERAAMNLNEDIRRLGDGEGAGDMQLYIQDAGVAQPTALAITSQKYGRAFNWEMAKQVSELPSTWRNPPARPCGEKTVGSRIATAEDCVKSSIIRPGDEIIDAGVYGSAEDIFIFMIDGETTIPDGTDGGLSRGFFVSNSEVGKATFDFTTFLYRTVCGNHIVWDAQNIKQIKIKHLGKNTQVRALAALSAELKKYREASITDEAAKIVVAKSKEIAPTLDAISDLLYGTKKLGLTRDNIAQAYQAAEENEKTDGNPRSYWGLVQGLTRISQRQPYADARTELDKAAGRVLQMAF